MSGAEGVELRLVPTQEGRQAVSLANGREPFVPAREDLVDVGLVPGIPDQPVRGRFEDVVEGDREFGDPQAGGKVAAELM